VLQRTAEQHEHQALLDLQAKHAAAMVAKKVANRAEHAALGAMMEAAAHYGGHAAGSMEPNVASKANNKPLKKAIQNTKFVEVHKPVTKAKAVPQKKYNPPKAVPLGSRDAPTAPTSHEGGPVAMPAAPKAVTPAGQRAGEGEGGPKAAKQNTHFGILGDRDADGHSLASDLRNLTPAAPKAVTPAGQRAGEGEGGPVVNYLIKLRL